MDAVAVIAEELQRYYWALTGEQHDPDQAVALVARLLPSIPEGGREGYGSRLENFVQDHAAKLQHLLGDRRAERGLHWLLRPEILLILERLSNQPFALRKVWDAEFPVPELDAIAAAWGPT
jgi:hypothetical protein